MCLGWIRAKLKLEKLTRFLNQVKLNYKRVWFAHTCELSGWLVWFKLDSRFDSDYVNES